VQDRQMSRYRVLGLTVDRGVKRVQLGGGKGARVVVTLRRYLDRKEGS